jgi:hypothetical protein
MSHSGRSVLAAVAGELRDIADHIVDVGLISRTGEGHGDAGDLVPGLPQISGQGVLRPNDVQGFQRRRLFEAGRGSRAAVGQAIQHGAVEFGRAEADAAALHAFLEDFLASLNIGGGGQRESQQGCGCKHGARRAQREHAGDEATFIAINRLALFRARRAARSAGEEGALDRTDA